MDQVQISHLLNQPMVMMMRRDTMRAMAPQVRRIENMLARGTLASLNRARKMQRIQAKLLGGEGKQGIEFFENYGFTSAPHDGAEVFAAFLDGDRSHGVALCIADRRFRILLEQGEVAIYDDQDHKVHLKRESVEVYSAAHPVKVYDDQGQRVEITRSEIVVESPINAVRVISAVKLRVEAPLLECTGNIKDLCDSTGTTMLQMRTTYNAHYHEPSRVPPTEQM